MPRAIASAARTAHLVTTTENRFVIQLAALVAYLVVATGRAEDGRDVIVEGVEPDALDETVLN